MTFINYVPAKIADIPDILSLMRRSKLHFHPGKIEYVDQFVEIWSPRAHYVEDNILLKAMLNDAFIGLIGMRAPNLNRTHAELDLLFLDPLYIGKGYGRLLWNEVLNIAKQQRWYSFKFISDKIPEITAFYQHMGAKQVDELKLDSGIFPIMEYRG